MEGPARYEGQKTEGRPGQVGGLRANGDGTALVLVGRLQRIAGGHQVPAHRSALSKVGPLERDGVGRWSEFSLNIGLP